MKTCYINVSPEQVKDSLQIVKDKNPDSVLVLAPVCGIETGPCQYWRENCRLDTAATVPDRLKLAK
jgi:hypothetical protein